MSDTAAMATAAAFLGFLSASNSAAVVSGLKVKVAAISLLACETFVALKPPVLAKALTVAISVYGLICALWVSPRLAAKLARSVKSAAGVMVTPVDSSYMVVCPATTDATTMTTPS